MTPEQSTYYERELKRFKSKGSKHDAFLIDCVYGMGSSNLGPVDPPVVGFGQDDDPHYTQYLHNWDEVEELIKQLRDVATTAWGPMEASNGS